jgi:hypothetical protein
VRLCRQDSFSFDDGGNPSGTQLCDPADKLHWNGFVVPVTG